MVFAITIKVPFDSFWSNIGNYINHKLERKNLFINH